MNLFWIVIAFFVCAILSTVLAVVLTGALKPDSSAVAKVKGREVLTPLVYIPKTIETPKILVNDNSQNMSKVEYDFSRAYQDSGLLSMATL